HPLAAVFVPVRTEQLIFAWLVFWNGCHEVCDVEKVLVAQVLGDAVLLPRTAAHAQRESKSAVEPAAIAEGVGEVHEHTHDLEVLGELARMGHILGMDPAGMPSALMIENRAHDFLGRGKIRGAVDGKNKRKLLARERVLRPYSALLHH